MIARNFRELAAWQRANELRLLCLELLKRPRVQANAEYRQQLKDAAGSVARNIAEGFGRFRPRQNAQYVRVSCGSAEEIMDLFIEGHECGYISDEEFPKYETAARRAIGTIKNYLKYLDSCDAPNRKSKGSRSQQNP